jgi:hypothetical protein
MHKRVRLLIMAATLALAASLVVAAPAHAVETTAVRVEAVAAFNDGNWGWYKLVLEKDTSNNKGRIKITAWCEPDNVLGGTKVPCDAIKYGNDKAIDPTGHGWLMGDYWSEDFGVWVASNVIRNTDQDITADYSPPAAGYAIDGGWECSGQGTDQYRGHVASFAIASSNQWSSWKERVTPTWNGTLC